MAHQLIGTHFRSFDRQSEVLAVVTVRETWRDTLHAYEGDWPYWDEPAISARGPYDLDVTYVLELGETWQGPAWQVTQATYANEPPAWQVIE
jgi:hypothetical protein